MKDKIIGFFNKRTSYYEPDENTDVNSSSNSNSSKKKSYNQLKKENDDLKRSLEIYALDKFKSRRSVRKFSDQDVPWEKIYNIIEAGLNGPVAGGVQNYKIIVVEDPNQRKEIGKCSFQQYWLADAPYLLVVVRDNHRLMQLYPSEGEIYSIQNSAALIENMIMMAHFYGLGTCWVEAYNNSVLKEMLSVPMEFKIDAIIPIGYPLETPQVEKNPTTAHLFFKKYGEKHK